MWDVVWLRLSCIVRMAPADWIAGGVVVVVVGMVGVYAVPPEYQSAAIGILAVIFILVAIQAVAVWRVRYLDCIGRGPKFEAAVLSFVSGSDQHGNLEVTAFI